MRVPDSAETVESPQLVPSSVSVYGRLSSGNDFQMSWTTSNSGDGDLAASRFSVSCVLGSGARFRALKCSGYSSANVV